MWIRTWCNSPTLFLKTIYKEYLNHHPLGFTFPTHGLINFRIAPCLDVLDGVSFNWTEIVYQIRIYTGKLNEYYVNSEDIFWNKISQYPACQILDVMEYFTEYKEEHILQIFIDFNQVQDVGVSIFFEEKNKVLSRRLKTNMLSYVGPSFQYDDLFLPQDKKGIFSFHQNIYSEKEENKQCKNYPFNGSASFGDCDKKYLYNKFLHFYNIMPFWMAMDLSEVTNHRLVYLYLTSIENIIC